MAPAAVQRDPIKRLANALVTIAAALKASASAPEDAEPPRSGTRAKSLLATVRAIRRIAFEVLLVALVLMLVAVVAKATFKRATIIEPISVPWELSVRGYTGQVISQQLIDEIKAYTELAQSSRATGELSMLPPDQTIPKIEVPGAGISLEAIIYYVREFLNVADKKLGGEITREPVENGQRQTYRFRIRISEGTHRYISSEPSDDINALLKSVALQILERTSPYIAGLIHVQRQEYSEAAHMAQLCMRGEGDCDWQWGMNLWGRIDNAEGRYADAENDFETAIRRAPKFILPKYNLGSVAYSQGHYPQAFQHSLEAVLFDSDSQRRHIGYLNAAQTLVEMINRKIAYRQTAELQSVLWRLVISGTCSIDNTKIPQLIAIEGFPPREDPTEFFGLQDGKIPSWKSAIDFLRCAAEADPVQPVVFYRLGLLFFQDNKMVDAQHAYEKSIALSSEISQYNVVPYAHSDLGRVLAAQSQFAKAYSEFDVASRLKPDYSWTYVRWAEALAESLKSPRAANNAASIRGEAETKISQAIALDGRNPNLKMTAADICKELDDFERAEELYKEIISESPSVTTPVVIEAQEKLSELQRRQQSH